MYQWESVLQVRNKYRGTAIDKATVLANKHSGQNEQFRGGNWMTF